ncbi:MAG TPA: hypothetical protein IGS53_11935, partial [Leptolyngbyaceae cyanobacterium M33_DOE_097]|nr:hypothetical protein [Leptolyngbyaceae cyanobacterium M33_DOE_097]
MSRAWHFRSRSRRAHLAVGGVQSGRQRAIAKQGIEPPIYPGDPEMQQMIETSFTPAHSS